MRDMAAERGDLADHRALIGRFHRRQHGRHHDRTHHRERRRQADLKADAFGQFAALARRHKVQIRRARLARVAEFAETHVRGFDALRQREQRKSVGRAHRAGGIGPQIRARAQQRILPADPQPPAADFAVGHAAQIRPQQLSDGAKDLLDVIEADTADEMNVHRFFPGTHEASFPKFG